MAHLKGFTAAILAALLTATSVPAQTADTDTAEALGALRAVFYHELGHGLIDVLDLDVVGAEENVVDEFSTMLLILQGRRDNRQIEALLSTARFWALASSPAEEAMRYYSEHDFNSKRFFNIVCLLHGSDPGRFYPIMTELDIPERRARRCELEFHEKSENWVNILAPHVRGNAPADRQGSFVVQYAPAQSEAAQGVARIWQQTRFVESLALEAGAIFPLPSDLPVIARECGMANAFWDGRGITLCYELHLAIARSFSGARDGVPDPKDKVRDTGLGAGPGGGGSVNVGDLLGGE